MNIFIDEHFERILQDAAQRYEQAKCHPKSGCLAAGHGDVKKVAEELDDFFEGNIGALCKNLMRASDMRILVAEDQSNKLRYYYSELGFVCEADSVTDKAWPINTEDAVRAMVAFGHLMQPDPAASRLHPRANAASYMHNLFMRHCMMAPVEQMQPQLDLVA